MADERAAPAGRLNIVAAAASCRVPTTQHPRSKPGYPRPATTCRQQQKWVTGGPGMQAVFLDSGANNKSCGTGVFLPQIWPPHIHQLHPTKKPACSRPVLLPSRVVQALNLNVHDFGLKVTRSRKGQKREEEPILEPTHVLPEKECLLPDIFLPKEWTY